MNSEAKQGIFDILRKLDEDNLFALARTVTQGLLKRNSTDEAISGIIKYSPDVLSILRRKMLTRDILFSYLDEKGIPIKLPITKNELIDKIIEFWNVSQTADVNFIEVTESRAICKDGPQGTSANDSEKRNISLLAEQFSKWFYSMMNGDGVGSEHFYPDAKLLLNIYSNSECDSNVIENNPEEIAQALCNIKVQYNLYFNINPTSDGIQGSMDSHGLVIVLVCGTLHIQNSCVGVFEQMFALARDPYCDNNWKIKNSELNLRSKNGVIKLPSQCDTEMTSAMLTLPSNE